jgi:hypothetical protein
MTEHIPDTIVSVAVDLISGALVNSVILECSKDKEEVLNFYKQLIFMLLKRFVAEDPSTFCGKIASLMYDSRNLSAKNKKRKLFAIFKFQSLDASFENEANTNLMKKWSPCLSEFLYCIMYPITTCDDDIHRAELAGALWESYMDPRTDLRNYDHDEQCMDFLESKMVYLLCSIFERTSPERRQLISIMPESSLRDKAIRVLCLLADRTIRLGSEDRHLIVLSRWMLGALNHLVQSSLTLELYLCNRFYC